MKRDMELVRKILIALEIQEDKKSSISVEGYKKNEIAHHCSMMYDYGLIKSFKVKAVNNDPYFFWTVKGLTWEGYEFLDKIRDDGTWQKTVKTITEKGLDMSIKTISAVSTAFITAATEGAVTAILKNGGIN